MNFRHLKIFLAVCDQGSMTRAAKQLYMTQPSVSQVIAELENEYAVRLFERLNHRLFITAAGERLQSYARHILHLTEQAEKELLDMGRHGSLRIGASLTIGAYLLPELLAAFQAQAPEVDVFSRVDNTAVIERLILEDQLDFGLVEGPIHSEQIFEENYCADYLIFICSAQHPLAQKGTVTPADLAQQPFIVREAGSGTQDIFEHAMQDAGINWKAAGVYNNIEAIKQSVLANLGLAVVSQIAVAEEIRQGRLVRLEVPGMVLRRKFNLIYHQQKFFSQAMQSFWEVSKARIKPVEDQVS